MVGAGRLVRLLLEFYVLAISEVITRWISTCESVLYYDSTASLGNQASGNMTQYPTQSRYPDIGLNIPSAMLLMLSTKLISIFQLLV